MKPSSPATPKNHSLENDYLIIKSDPPTSLEEILSLVAKKTHNSVVITDASRKIIWINKAFTKNTGYTLKEVMGRVNGHFLQGKDTNPETVKYMRKRLNEKKPFECEVLNYTKKGDKLWFSLNVKPVFDKKKQLVNFVGIASNITRQKELEIILNQQRETEQKRLLQTTIEAQEKERNALGFELHDNINQMLGVVVLYNGMIRTEKNNTQLIIKQAEILQSCITEIRTLSHRLVTPSLQRKFEDEIKSLLNNTLPAYYFNVKLKFEGEGIKKLSPEVQLHLFRILQEQMNNIIKHSAGNQVSILFKCSKDHLLLTIKDNGIGSKKTAASEGIGLLNISNRVKLINAELSIKTFPGKGFKLSVKVPL